MDDGDAHQRSESHPPGARRNGTGEIPRAEYIRVAPCIGVEIANKSHATYSLIGISRIKSHFDLSRRHLMVQHLLTGGAAERSEAETVTSTGSQSVRDACCAYVHHAASLNHIIQRCIRAAVRPVTRAFIHQPAVVVAHSHSGPFVQRPRRTPTHSYACQLTHVQARATAHWRNGAVQHPPHAGNTSLAQ